MRAVRSELFQQPAFGEYTDIAKQVRVVCLCLLDIVVAKSRHGLLGAKMQGLPPIGGGLKERFFKHCMPNLTLLAEYP